MPASLGLPPRPPIPEYIGATSSIIDLLNASAHDPELSWDDSDEDDTDDESSLATPSDSSEHLHGTTPKDPPSLDGKAPFHPSGSNDRIEIVRGVSLLTPGAGDSSFARDLAIDSINDVDEAVLRAQQGRDGSAAEDDSFEDSKDVDGDKTPEARLKTLVEEFGPWSDDSEVFIQSIPGALYRGVLVKGLLALTNRRFFIYAFVPRQEANKLIRAGPVTVHFPGTFTRKKRVWIELRSDSSSWYRSSTKTHKPLGSCRLSQMKELLPYNPEEQNFVRLELIDGRSRAFELDTRESAVAWRSDMEAALFTFRATADKLRLSLPLRLIQSVVYEPYMTLAERVQIQFDSGRCPYGSDDDRSSITSTDSSGDSVSSVSRAPTEVEFGYLKSHHTFVESLQEYVEKASSLPPCGVRPVLELDSEVRAGGDEIQKEAAADKGSLAAGFVNTFALHDRPSDLFVAPHCDLVRSLPTWGSLAISHSFLCFWRKGILTADVKLRIPLTDIDSVGPSKAWGFRIVGLAVQIHGAPDVRLDFHSTKFRDEVISKLKEALLVAKAAALTVSPSPIRPSPGGALLNSFASSSSSGSNPSFKSVVASSPYVLSPVRTSFQGSRGGVVVLGQSMEENVALPAGFTMPEMPSVIGTFGSKSVTGLHFVCLTIGSRGDVQPYIALARELMKDGNRVTIASHPEYRSWVEGYGIGYREVGGDPAALMKLSVEHKMFSPAFFRESLGKFRGWLDDLFAESWTACQDADVLIESPSTMAGIHVAEGLGIPYFRAFTMPWTSTSTYPQAFAASVNGGATYNLYSYSIFDNIIWKATAGQVNRWRKNQLNLPPTSMHKMAAKNTPFCYNFSSAVVPKPNDWRDNITISGYWFLDDERPWTPPEGLMEFIAQAREDGKAVIYIGFGSIVVPDATAVTKAVVAAVLNSGVRAILAKGWSDRGAAPTEEVVFPPEIFSVLSVPHDRLFPLIDAACHHGGAGTTGASLRAGLPTLIHPFFGDQYFWAQRVEKLGAGAKITSLTEKDLTAAFKLGTTNHIMREKASAVGEKIRAENGQRAACHFFYDHLHLAQRSGELRAARAKGGKPDNLRTACVVQRFSMNRAGTLGNKRSGTPPRSSTPTRAATLPATFPSSPLPIDAASSADSFATS